MKNKEITMLNVLPYCLIHISKSDSIKKICCEKTFIPSKHDPKMHKIQWLGDGVYFWDQNDYTSRKLGEALARGKFFRHQLYGICINVQINDENYLNLEEIKWAKKFEEFLKTFQPDNYEKIKNYLEMIKKYDKPDHMILNNLGIILGTAINLFIKILQQEYKYKIDMVSAYFYHEKRNSILLQRTEKEVQQFCIRNLGILNKSIENSVIVHIN